MRAAPRSATPRRWSPMPTMPRPGSGSPRPCWRSKPIAAASVTICLRRAINAGIEHDKAGGDLALQFVGNADHGAFGHILVAGYHLFHLPGREAVTGDIDDVVGSRHHVDVAVGIHVARIRGGVVARELGKVTLPEAPLVAPQRRQA